MTDDISRTQKRRCPITISEIWQETRIVVIMGNICLFGGVLHTNPPLELEFAWAYT